MASNLYCSPYSYRNSCRSFSILKAIVKSIAITIVGRMITIERKIKKKSKEIIPNMKQKNIIIGKMSNNTAP